MQKHFILPKNTAKKSEQNPLQKTFNRLKKKILSMQKECLECTKALDRDLQFYNEIMLPQLKKIADFLREEIKLFYPYLHKKNCLKKTEKENLRNVLESLFKKIFEIEGPSMKLDPELSAIHKEILGFSHEEEVLNQFELFKKDLEKKFHQKGIKIDLEQMKFEGSLGATMDNIFTFIREEGISHKDFEFPPNDSKKTQKISPIEELQKKEIGTLYKQLAKKIHPDLETNEDRKSEKEALMKRLTCAYEDGDLHTLLTIELETTTADSESIHIHTEEQLKIYNNFLQSQVKTLQSKMNSILKDYKYENLQSLNNYKWKNGDFILRQITAEINEEILSHKAMIKECQGNRTLGNLRSIIKAHDFFKLEEEFGDDFFFDNF